MTITSVGYDGTIDEVQWAKIAGHLGAEYAVLGATDWKVEAVSGQERTVRVRPGGGYGHGVLDTSDAEVTLQLPAVTSGFTRWDLIVARRDWRPPGGATTFRSIEGAAFPTVPISRNTDPGVLDDQPVALVQVRSGATLPGTIVDLRVWPTKILTASTLLALPDAEHGSVALVGSTWHRRVIDDTGTASWVRIGSAVATTRQAADPPLDVTGAFVDFTEAQWPSLSFTMPASGQVFATISANLQNTNTETATIWAAFRVSAGALSFGGNQGDNGLSTMGGRLHGSRRTLITGEPGTDVTLKPQWNLSSGSKATASIRAGSLVVEPLP